MHRADTVVRSGQHTGETLTTVGVFVGSITDEALGAHAIVNASNAEVALGSGVSGAIREACGGKQYQALVREQFEDEYGRPLEADECLVTGSGICGAFRWVLHVPSVDYRHPDPETGQPSGPARIRRCTAAFLEQADGLATANRLEGKLIVGAPLLGANHGLQGDVSSADQMMTSISLYDRPDVGVAEVRFAVLQQEGARLIERCAFKHGLSFRAL